MSKPTLHLMVGLPGAGKSTLAKRLQTLTGATRLSSDEFRLLLFPQPTFTQSEHDGLYDILDHNVEHLLAAGKDVIYDANLNRRKHRDEKYKIAAKYNAKVVLWWPQVPKKYAKQRRADSQNHDLIPEGETSERMFDRVVSVFEPPQADEKYIEVDGHDIKPAVISAKLKTI